LDNTLYGTAAYGGSAGNGTVFELSLRPQLTIIPSGTDIILKWPTNLAAGFVLQSSPAATGPFTNVAGAITPYTNSIVGPQQFYRLIQ